LQGFEGFFGEIDERSTFIGEKHRVVESYGIIFYRTSFHILSDTI
jgi:hypothetical protein